MIRLLSGNPAAIVHRCLQIFTAWLFVASLVLASGCASAPDLSGEDSTAEKQYDGDPFETVNRKIFAFNLKADKYVLRPVAKVYVKAPLPVRNGIGNFFSNLNTIPTILYNVLQGEFADAGRNTSRFMINTLIGAGGLMDAATSFGLPEQREDFGKTLRAWGVPPGPFLMLPVLGPSTLRDVIDIFPPVNQTNPLNHLESPEEWYAHFLSGVHSRSGLLGTDKILEEQLDPYSSLRVFYLQSRTQDITNNEAANEKNEAELIDQLLEEE